MNNVLKDDEKLTNWELAMIDELDMILDCNYENLFDFTEEEKLDIARDFLNKEYQCWEDINIILMKYINDRLQTRLLCLKEKQKVAELDKEELYNLDLLEKLEKGELL